MVCAFLCDQSNVQAAVAAMETVTATEVVVDTATAEVVVMEVVHTEVRLHMDSRAIV